MVTTFDSGYKVNKPFANFSTHRSGFGEYTKGRYVCQTGFVLIYSDDKCATFDYLQSGRIYSRTIHGKIFTQKSLAITAGKFARQVEAMFE